MKRYRGDRYWDLDELERWCQDVASAAPEWVSLETVGHSREGRPLLLLTLGDQRADPQDRPAFWLDAGTHCTEWTGVMAAVFTISEWVSKLLEGDEATRERFRRHTAYVMPCISPDGYHALRQGLPFIRSTLRPPRDSRPRVGLEPSDQDGDGEVGWMRWKHPAGPWVFPTDNPIKMRHRTLDDDPKDAWMVCDEGEFLEWDGVRWTSASLKHGVDLNRNFPASWAPFSMFGMDSGEHPMSEPESLAVVQAFAARKRIGCALTNHTYTGCLLTQPYRDPSPLGDSDIRAMERLGEQSTEGTGYPVMRVVPDFTYDAKKPVVGVWADAMTLTFGVPAYTLELWDPFGHNGITIDDPASFFRKPDLELMGKMVDGFFEKDPTCVRPWRPFKHAQLGDVELGGLDYMHTVRNPPLEHLPAEVEKGFRIADRLFRALTTVHGELRIRPDGDVRIVELVLENRGYLGSASMAYAESIGAAAPIVATLHGVQPLEGMATRNLGWLAGWGDLQNGSATQPIYPGLPLERDVRTVVRWVVPAAGEVRVSWDAGRGGKGGILESEIPSRSVSGLT